MEITLDLVWKHLHPSKVIVQDYIDAAESHKQLDSILKTRNKSKYNSKKLDKKTKLTFVFLGWHFQTTSSKKMVKEGKLDNGGASRKKLGLICI